MKNDIFDKYRKVWPFVRMGREVIDELIATTLKGLEKVPGDQGLNEVLNDLLDAVEATEKIWQFIRRNPKIAKEILKELTDGK